MLFHCYEMVVFRKTICYFYLFGIRKFIKNDSHPNTGRQIRRDATLNEFMNALISFLPSSLEEEQSGCLEEHHLGQW